MRKIVDALKQACSLVSRSSDNEDASLLGLLINPESNGGLPLLTES